MISVDIFGSKFISNTGKPGKSPVSQALIFEARHQY